MICQKNRCRVFKKYIRLKFPCNQKVFLELCLTYVQCRPNSWTDFNQIYFMAYFGHMLGRFSILITQNLSVHDINKHKITIL